jgi:aspartate carbamoyltransferase catalytic subunit
LNHLLSTQSLNIETALQLFQLSNQLKSSVDTKQLLPNKLLATLFYEASTRTRVSFEIAGKKLGMDVINLDPAASSIQKGESLEDTARTLVDLGVDLVVMRHPSSGAAISLAKNLADAKIQVINAGDGMNEHPSQALLDLYSIHETTDSIKNKKVVIVGDCLHSRVARSNIYLLQKFGAQVHLCGPPSLVPDEFAAMNVVVWHDLKSALKDADYVIVLRLQKERQTAGLIPSQREYKNAYGLNEKLLEEVGLSLKKVKILHPGPVNRDVEIETSLVDNESVSLIHRQVYNGLYVLMAILLTLLGNNLIIHK